MRTQDSGLRRWCRCKAKTTEYALEQIYRPTQVENIFDPHLQLMNELAGQLLR